MPGLPLGVDVEFDSWKKEAQDEGIVAPLVAVGEAQEAKVQVNWSYGGQTLSRPPSCRPFQARVLLKGATGSWKSGGFLGEGERANSPVGYQDQPNLGNRAFNFLHCTPTRPITAQSRICTAPRELRSFRTAAEDLPLLEPTVNHVELTIACAGPSCRPIHMPVAVC